MKLPAVAVCLLFAASVMQAQTPPTPPSPAGPPTPPAKVTTTPAKKATPAKKEEKKEEKLPDIPGTVIVRTNGTKLGIEIAGGKFKLTFYDKKHKPMAADVTRVNARWPNNRSNTPSDFRTVLNGSGATFVSEKTVQPPHVFLLFLTLLQGEGDAAKAVENYSVQFKG